MAKRGGWKRGARKGNYTDMQINIACRISKMGFHGGQQAYIEPDNCPIVTQARISLGYLPVKTCATTWEASPCHLVGVTAPSKTNDGFGAVLQ